MSFWGRLFGKKKEQTVVKVHRKKHVHLSKEDKANLVTDYMINKMSIEEITSKYGVVKKTVYNIIRKARNVK